MRPGIAHTIGCDHSVSGLQPRCVGRMLAWYKKRHHKWSGLRELGSGSGGASARMSTTLVSSRPSKGVLVNYQRVGGRRYAELRSQPFSGVALNTQAINQGYRFDINHNNRGVSNDEGTRSRWGCSSIMRMCCYSSLRSSVTHQRFNPGFT
jgi:hypothetical protein